MKFTKKSIYISLFGILYLIVAFSSFFHAVEFFELSNVWWMSIILALAFEIGQAAVLLSILTSKKERNKITPWILMGILTVVQIIGNIYSSYKYIMLNSPENLKYFKEPIFIWTDLPDTEATVIITYISSAILPLTALLLTSMITNYLTNSDSEEQIEQIKDDKYEELKRDVDKLKRDNIWSMEEDDIDDELEDSLEGPPEGEGRSDEQEIKDLNILLDGKDKEIERLKQELENKNELEILNSKVIEDSTENAINEEIVENEHNEEKLEEQTDDLNKQNDIDKESTIKPSHFINLK